MNYRLDWKGWTFWQFPLFFEFPIDFLSKDRGMWLASEWKKGEVVVLLSYYFWGHSSRHSWPHFGENTKRFFIFLSWNSSRTKKHLKVTKSNFLNLFQAKIWKYLNFHGGNWQNFFTLFWGTLTMPISFVLWDGENPPRHF